MTARNNLGGKFTFAGSSTTVHRLGYGAMQLAGPNVFGPPKDKDAALRVLRFWQQKPASTISTPVTYMVLTSQTRSSGRRFTLTPKV